MAITFLFISGSVYSTFCGSISTHTHLYTIQDMNIEYSYGLPTYKTITYYMYVICIYDENAKHKLLCIIIVHHFMHVYIIYIHIFW